MNNKLLISIIIFIIFTIILISGCIHEPKPNPPITQPKSDLNQLQKPDNEQPKNKEKLETCKDLCGDGICQEIVCQAIGCPCAETEESCPQDCAVEENIPLLDNMLQDCPTQEEISRFEHDFNISSDEAFVEYSCANGINPNYPSGKLDPRLTLYQMLRLMNALEFSKPLPWTDKSLYDWFKGNIKGIYINNSSEYSFCCDPERVINLKGEVVGASYDANWVMGAGMAYLIVLAIHEARHIDVGHTCGSNDNNLDELGAWAIQYYLEYWLVNYLPSNYQTQNEKENLASDAEYILHTRFCNTN
ncbi:MAG: hypothetical protein COT15_04195 [Candidatus Diapherotrites archaeon CG08_land_8_20_14_0_20_34_12]|nr:MAG: hypothetical protein COT15_04195 [Candidatus Diapherotrites archaeon CG08_land_8_20_14_0_20_34_12]